MKDRGCKQFCVQENLLHYSEHRRGSSSAGFRGNEVFAFLCSSQDVWQTTFHSFFLSFTDGGGGGGLHMFPACKSPA